MNIFIFHADIVVLFWVCPYSTHLKPGHQNNHNQKHRKNQGHPHFGAFTPEFHLHGFSISGLVPDGMIHRC